MKVLNLYAGIGGNRKLWEGCEVTAVELNKDIANIYKKFYPNDNVIIGDAHKYLIKHMKDYNFIWSSPPCQTHSRLRLSWQNNIYYPRMELYQEIIILQNFFKGFFVVENVIPYYDALIKPTVQLSRHNFWSNFIIPKKSFNEINKVWDDVGVNDLMKFHNIILPKSVKNKRLLLRNCVNPYIGKYIYDCAFKYKNNNLLSYG